MKKIFIFLVLTFLIVKNSFSQYSVEQINDLKEKLLNANTDSSRFSLTRQLANGFRFSNIDSSIFYTDAAISLADKLGDKQKAKANMLSLKGATFLEAGRIPESLQLQFEALDISENIRDTTTIGYAYNRIGNIYMELADYKKANEYYFISKLFFEKIKFAGMIYNEMSNIGNIYELMHMPDSALYYQRIVYEASKKSSGRNGLTRPEIMFRMGNAFKAKENNDSAFVYYKAGIIESGIDNDTRNLTMNTLLIALLYHDLNNPDSSMKYAYSAIKTGKQVSFRKGIYAASMLLSTLFKEKNYYDSAYKYLSAADIEKDSLIGAKRFQDLQRIVLNEQEKQRQSEAKTIAIQNRQKQYTLLIGLGIFLIIAMILYRNNRQKQKTNKVLESTLGNLKSTQSQLIQSEKMASLGELTAGIAHEIQNPLNFVNNFSEVSNELIDEMNAELNRGDIEEAKIIGNDIKQNLEKINHHGKRADAIVKGMLQHSQSSSGKKEPTDINKLADEYLRLAYHGLRAKDKSFNATLKTDFDNSIGNINIIQQDIGRVMLNLITNAFYVIDEKKKASTSSAGQSYEPTVSVSTKKMGDKVSISVNDNGNGIPKNILDKIFQPFFTTKPTGQGTGLGLSLSYDIVKAHGGALKVETTEKHSTTFIIQLPVNT